MKSNILNIRVKKTILSFNRLLEKGLSNFDKLCLISSKAIKNNKKIIFFGNGGSAADAQHLAAELVVKLKSKRKAIAAMALTTNTSVITAISNDYDFSYIFARQIEALGNAGDVAIAISTSGNSLNLIKGINLANKKKLITFCLAGKNGGVLKNIVKYPIILEEADTAICQTMQILIGQVFCEILEKNI